MVDAVALAGMGLIAMLAVARLYHDLSAEHSWDDAMSGRTNQALDRLSAQFAAERDAAGIALDSATNARQRSEVVRVVQAGAAYLEAVCPDRILLTRKLGVLSRMADALAPLPALSPAAFRATSLSALAALGVLLHATLVSVAERFRLRVWLLGVGFSLMLRDLAGLRRRVSVETVESELRRALDARADFAVLDEETLESARVLLTALARRS